MSLPHTTSFAGISAGQDLHAFAADWENTKGKFEGSSAVADALAAHIDNDVIARYTGAVFAQGHRSGVLIPAQLANYNPFIGPACRVDAAGDAYGAIWSNNAETVFLNRYAGGTFAAIFGADVPLTAAAIQGKTLWLEFLDGGVDWVLYADATVLASGTATGPALLTGGAGMAGFNSGAIPSTGTYITSVTVDNISGPAGPVVPVLLAHLKQQGIA